MTLSPGTRLDPYEITAPIGAGGTCEVDCVRDSMSCVIHSGRWTPGAGAVRLQAREHGVRLA